MQQFEVDLSGALLWLEEHHRLLESDFMSQYTQLKALIGFNNPRVTKYVEGLGNWVRANDCWNFESQRYFGDKGRSIQITRHVPLLPT